MIEVFLDDTPGLMTKAVEAANQNNADALRAAAHAVKGSMLFLNPRQALQCAQQVEQLAADGRVEASRQMLDDLHAHFAAVCQSLESYLARNRK